MSGSPLQPPQLVLGLCLLACGCPFLESGLLPAGKAITNGVEEPGYPAVGMVGSAARAGNMFCTGTLIGCKTVLTAAHCVSQERYHYDTASDRNLPEPVSCRQDNGGQWACDTDSNVSVYREMVTTLGCPKRSECGFARNQAYASAAPPKVHPRWWPFGRRYPQAAEWGYDLAVIRLAERPRIDPRPLQSTRLITSVPVTLVGYGITSPHAVDYGTKRRGNSQALDSPGHRIAIHSGPSFVASGDSGGPIFAGSKRHSQRVTGVSVGTEYIAPDVSRLPRFAIGAQLDLQWLRQASAGDIAIDSPLSCENPPWVTITDSGPAYIDTGNTAEVTIGFEVEHDKPLAEARILVGGKVVWTGGASATTKTTVQLTLPVGESTVEVEVENDEGIIGRASVKVYVLRNKPDGADSCAGIDVCGRWTGVCWCNPLCKDLPASGPGCCGDYDAECGPKADTVAPVVTIMAPADGAVLETRQSTYTVPIRIAVVKTTRSPSSS